MTFDPERMNPERMNPERMNTETANTETANTERRRNPEPSTRAVYVISVAAELAGVHPQTLRVYERRGLVDPSRTGGGNRRYSQRDIEQLRRIEDLTAAGLNLEGVRRVLELEADVARLTGRGRTGPAATPRTPWSAPTVTTAATWCRCAPRSWSARPGSPGARRR